jgi:hypothetical protein
MDIGSAFGAMKGGGVIEGGGGWDGLVARLQMAI